jgi:aspartyl aminopeptidase
MVFQAAPEAASRFLKFVNASPTPFHAVQRAALHLESAGFKKVGAGPHRVIPSLDSTFCRFERKMTGRRRSNLEGGIISLGQNNFLLLYTLLDRDCRNQASLVAFTLPHKWKQGAGLSIVATHVDSPNLRVRRNARCHDLLY